MSNPHTLFLYFFSWKNICNPPPTISNTAKIAQFAKGIGKIWVVWCKGVKCLLIGELKQIRISSLRSLIIPSLPMEYKVL